MDGWDFRPPDERGSEAQAPAQPTSAPVTPGQPDGETPQVTAQAPLASGPEGTPEPHVPPPVQPPFDWLTEVLIPIAVFGLLASFFYYLIDLRGAAGDRGLSGLRWVCFWFLLGAILTTRMRTRYGAHILALPYMLGLALAVALFIFHFTMYSGAFVRTGDLTGQVVDLIFNYALVGIIWWVANVVTRACTAEENFMAMTDEGLLSSIRRRRQPQRKKARDAQTRHPGWVLMWTSFVALISFAFGQQMIGASSTSHRAHAFMCMVSYSFFALLLLALTSLSAMRMSARRRKIKVAGGITPVWTLASTLIVMAILLLAALLPRVRVESVSRRLAQLPQGWREPPETSWENAPAYGARRPRENPGGDRRADEEAGSRPGAKGNESGQHPESGQEKSQTPSGGPQGQEAGTPQAGGSGEKGDESASSGAVEGRGGEGAQGESGEAEQERSGASQNSTGEGETEQDETPSESDGTAGQGRGDEEREANVSSAGTGNQPSRPSEAGAERNAAGSVDWLKMLLLWLAILLLLLLLLLLIAYLIYRLLKNRKQLPSFRGWLASMWQISKEAVQDVWARTMAALAAAWAFVLRLLGWRPKRPKLGEDGLPEDPFTDIFTDRELAESLTPAQVVRHVYAAFQAFGDLIGYGRDDQQTPNEYLRALPKYIGGMPRHDADDLTGLYVKAAYSPEEVGEEEVERVRRIWERMQTPIDEAMAKRKKGAAAVAEQKAA